MKLFETQGGYIAYDPEKRIMTAKFTGFMNGPHFREFMQTGLKELKAKLSEGNVLWLADTRDHQVAKREETDWVAQVWTPEAMEAGLTHIAFVLPKNVFAEISVSNYQEKAKAIPGLAIKNFDDLSKAEDWYTRR